MEQPTKNPVRKEPWNKGKLVGQKPPLKLKEIWAIRIRLQLANRHRDLALFNLALRHTPKWRHSQSQCGQFPTQHLERQDDAYGDDRPRGHERR